MQKTINREGMALPTALLAIVLIGALIAGTFFATNQEYRVARTSLSSERALMAAEYGQNRILNDWDMNWNNNMKTGDTVKRIYSAGNATVDTVIVTRLRFNMFQVASTGRDVRDPSSDARRRVGLLVRLDIPELPFYGAFNGARSIGMAGNYTGSGNDSIPTGWTDCPPPLPQRPAIASTSTANVSGQGSGCAGPAYTCITGTPKIGASADIGDTTKVLDNWAELVAAANVVYDQSVTTLLNQLQPSYNGTACNKADPKNWGEPVVNVPATDCQNYFPVIYLKSAAKGATGPTTTISQGRGQGILLVDANVSFNGNFQWIGPVIVRGNVSSAGNGNKVIGGVTALNQGCTAATCNSLSGTSSFTYSSCSITKILALKSKPVLTRHRPWTDLY